MRFDFFDIEKLRSYPASVRAQIAFGAAAVVSGTIGIIWLTTLGTRFSDMQHFAEIPEVPEAQVPVAAEETPRGQSWSAFTARVQSQTAAVIEAFKSVRIDLEDDGVYLDAIEATTDASQPPVSAAPEPIFTGSSTVKTGQ